MNNNQFILIIGWITLTSAALGYQTAGYLGGLAAFVGIPVFFLLIGD